MRNNLTSVPLDRAPGRESDALRTLFDRHFSVELALTSRQINEALTLRYQVYCLERPFEDANCFPDHRERDGYDYRSVHAVVRHRLSGECAATVRLVLPDEHDPDEPFPLETHCSDAMPHRAKSMLTTTSRKRVAEISRFAVSRGFRQRMRETSEAYTACEGAVRTGDEDQRVMPYITLGLFAAVLRISAGLGISHWIAVMEPTLLRLLHRYGIEFPHVGRAVNYHGRRKPVAAEASALVEAARHTHPDTWAMVTDAGRILPPEPAPSPITGVRLAARSEQPTLYPGGLGAVRHSSSTA